MWTCCMIAKNMMYLAMNQVNHARTKYIYTMYYFALKSCRMEKSLY